MALPCWSGDGELKAERAEDDEVRQEFGGGFLPAAGEKAQNRLTFDLLHGYMARLIREPERPPSA